LGEQNRSLILISNDDGIDSPGMRAAAESVAGLGDVWVIAPLTQQSGLGRSFPTHSSLHVDRRSLDIDGRRVPFVAIDASPAQAVRHGILRFVPRPPDLVISGINYGENVGGSVTISGTVGAAIEAASFGIPALAVSLETAREYHFSHSTEIDFCTASVITRRFAKYVLQNGMPAGVDILKIDVPLLAQRNTPFRVTRLSRQQYFVNPVVVDDRGEKQLSRYVAQFDAEKLERDSDVYALAVDHVVSVTPLTIDLTAKTDLGRLQKQLVLDESGCNDPDSGPDSGSRRRDA